MLRVCASTKKAVYKNEAHENEASKVNKLVKGKREGHKNIQNSNLKVTKKERISK